MSSGSSKYEGVGRSFSKNPLAEKLEQGKERGVNVEDLQKGDVVTLETMGGTYTLKILEPKQRKVEITAGPDVAASEYHQTRTDNIMGTSATSSNALLKIGWIIPGFPLLMSAMNPLPATLKVSVNGKSVEGPSE